MSDTSKREDMIRAVQAVTWSASNYPPKMQPHVLGQDIVPLTMKIVDAVEAVFEQAHAKELDTSTEPVKNGGDSLHVTPTDDEREALARIIEKVFLTTPHGARRYVEDIVAMPEWPFRRTAVQEPREARHICPAHPFGCPEPQDEPTDATVLAALNAKSRVEHEAAGIRRAFRPSHDLADYGEHAEAMRAALRAAAGIGQEEKR